MLDKVNQYNKRGRRHGYWHQTSTNKLFYYKKFYINGNQVGYSEHHFLSDKGKIVKEYYAR